LLETTGKGGIKSAGVAPKEEASKKGLNLLLLIRRRLRLAVLGLGVARLGLLSGDKRLLSSIGFDSIQLGIGLVVGLVVIASGGIAHAGENVEEEDSDDDEPTKGANRSDGSQATTVLVANVKAITDAKNGGACGGIGPSGKPKDEHEGEPNDKDNTEVKIVH